MHFHIIATTKNEFHIFMKCHFFLYPHCFPCNESSLALINIYTPEKSTAVIRPYRCSNVDVQQLEMVAHGIES